MIDVKGFDLLVEALALLGDERVHLTILGEGALRGKLEKTDDRSWLGRPGAFSGLPGESICMDCAG